MSGVVIIRERLMTSLLFFLSILNSTLLYMIVYNEQQLDTIKKCVEWYFCESYRKQIFVVAGLAGTGKTTVVKVIIKMLGLPQYNVLFTTLTGKASLVLRIKGNPSNTIHKTFYSTYKTGTGNFKFSLKNKISPMIKLIVIDEGSMVSQKMMDDIASFGVPIIVLMDPGQLPPIFGSNQYMEDESKLDVFLTEVRRQDDSSGILDLAMMARNNEPIPYGKYKNSLVTTFSEIEHKITEYDMVLCWKNSTRRKLNALIRLKKGYKTIYPVKGEKVLALRNNYNYELDFNDVPVYVINGMQGITTSDAYVDNSDELSMLRLDFVPDFIRTMYGDEYKYESYCFKEIFDQYRIDLEKDAFIESLMDETIDDTVLDNINMIDFGYAFTCHKSQGSEWPNVLVINEFKGSAEIYGKWLYTAITRAAKSVTIATLE